MAKKVDFNALVEKTKADYAYMDKLPLEGWIWEFIRRNKSYINLYNEIKHDLISLDLPKGCTGFDSTIKVLDESPIKDKIHRLLTDFNILTSFSDNQPRDADNFLYIEKLNLFANIPKPEIKFNQFFGDKPQILGASSVKSTVAEIGTVDFTKSSLSEREKKCHQMVMFELTPTFFTDTLYVGISLSAPKKEINRQLKALLNKHINNADIRAHDKKWKPYLTAYDLVNVEMISHEEAVLIYEPLFSNKKDRESIFANMMNNLARAEALINGDYKKFLHFKSRHVPFI